MELRHLARRVTHAGSAVPRLWTASLRAGTGVRGAIEVLRISEGALRIATRHGRGVPGRINAMRHFIWQALLAARFDARTAELIGQAQEECSVTAEDSRVDVHNNAVGRAHGEADAAELRRSSLSSALASLVPVALAKWDSGELTWVRPGSSR